jgi:hypothetical protein
VKYYLRGLLRRCKLKWFKIYFFQTVVEAYTVGVIVTFYDVSVVVQAFFLTSAVVVGLTIFTFQSKRDFSGWGTG